MIAASQFWSRLQQMIRLLVGGRIDEAKLPAPTKLHLAQIAGCDDFVGLRQEIEKTGAAVMQHVTSLLSVSPG
jgi:hypothetical protein